MRVGISVNAPQATAELTGGRRAASGRLRRSRVRVAVDRGRFHTVNARSQFFEVWEGPARYARFMVFVAQPGTYPYTAPSDDDPAARTELNGIVFGRAVITKDGCDPLEVAPGDTYVMKPGWSGRWDVVEAMTKWIVWVHDRPQ